MALWHTEVWQGRSAHGGGVASQLGVPHTPSLCPELPEEGPKGTQTQDPAGPATCSSTFYFYTCCLLLQAGSSPPPSLHQASANGVGLRVDDGGLQAHRGCAVCSPHASFLMSNSGGGFAQMGQWEETVPGD